MKPMIDKLFKQYLTFKSIMLEVILDGPASSGLELLQGATQSGSQPLPYLETWD